MRCPRCTAELASNGTSGFTHSSSVNALVQRHRGVQRLVQRTVDIVFTVDDHRRKQTGQCARRLDRARNGHMRVLIRSERHRVSRVEVGRHEKQLALQFAKVVGAPGCGEQPGEKCIDRAVVEHAGRDCLRQRRERFQDAPVQRIAQILQRGTRGETRQRGKAASEFGERGLEKDLRLQRSVRAVLDEEPVHLRRRDPVRERRGDEPAGRHADVDIEIVEIETVERIGQRQQRTDFVDAAQRAAARQRESDPWCCARRCTGGRALARPAALRAPGRRGVRHGSPHCPFGSLRPH